MCYKMSDNYCYVCLCRVYISAHLSAILSKLSPLFTLLQRQQGSSWSMLALAEKNLLPLCTHPAATHNCYLGCRLAPGMKAVLITTLSLE